MVKEESIKKAINTMIDLSNSNTSNWNAKEFAMRKHSIELAVYVLKTSVLSESINADPSAKYPEHELSQSFLKTA